MASSHTQITDGPSEGHTPTPVYERQIGFVSAIPKMGNKLLASDHNTAYAFILHEVGVAGGNPPTAQPLGRAWMSQLSTHSKPLISEDIMAVHIEYWMALASTALNDLVIIPPRGRPA